MTVKNAQTSLAHAEAPLAPRPGHRLMSAAISGLLAAGAGACGDDGGGDDHHNDTEDLSEEELAAVCEDMVEDAVRESEVEPDTEMSSCAEQVKEAANACLPLTATADEKTSNSEQKEYKFAELTKKCDERGGYVQIHAACGGVNTCQGFSFGDWGPDAALVSEHSCSGANGCAGLSCVVLPKDGGKSGEEVYDFEYPEPGPGACVNCHAVYEDGHDDPDVTKFKVWVQAGSTRTTGNWLDRTAAEQARVVAFGAHGVLPSGTAYQNMSAYNKVLSRAEIERVVTHLRTLTPVIKEVKITDPTDPTKP